ncbi:hypothetical protein TNCV_2728271 [Trichonephila clavipes]|nr:hypothetical protein TNCV_2728271 [Trichonephila clavipes]
MALSGSLPQINLGVQVSHVTVPRSSVTGLINIKDKSSELFGCLDLDYVYEFLQTYMGHEKVRRNYRLRFTIRDTLTCFAHASYRLPIGLLKFLDHALIEAEGDVDLLESEALVLDPVAHGLRRPLLPSTKLPILTINIVTLIRVRRFYADQSQRTRQLLKSDENLMSRKQSLKYRIQQQNSQNKYQKVFTPSTAIRHNTYAKDYSQAPLVLLNSRVNRYSIFHGQGKTTNR